MSNRMTVYGFLGKDAEFKEVNGKRIMELSIASNHKVKGDDVTVWRKITFWDDSHRNIEKYLKKGSALIISGEELPPTIYNGSVQLTMTGKDIMFSPFGKASKDKKDKDSSKTEAQPAKEEERLPGLPPC